MKKIEVNISHAERLFRLIISLPLGILIVYIGSVYLFFLPMYLVVTGVTGIGLEYNIKDMLQAKGPVEDRSLGVHKTQLKTTNIKIKDKGRLSHSA